MSHLVPEGIDIGQHGGCLWVGCHAWPELRLNASERGGELGGSRGTSLDFGECFVEYFGDVEQPDDIAILIADRLDVSVLELETYKMPKVLRNHQLEGLSGACRVSGDHWVLGHDLRDGCDPRVETLSGNLRISTDKRSAYPKS